MFDRGAGDDQAVEFLFFGLLEWLVECFHMFGGGVAGLVLGHPDERQFDLQGRCPDQTGELGFGLCLLGHQIQQTDFQRPDVLPVRGFLGHDRYTFALQHVMGGQAGGNADRHFGSRLALAGLVTTGFASAQGELGTNRNWA